MTKMLILLFSIVFCTIVFSPNTLTSTAVTEQQNAASSNLDQMSIKEIADLMNRENDNVLNAVATAKPQITTVIEKTVASFKAGGRLFYVGAGTSGRLGVIDAAECPPTFSTDPKMVQGIIAGGHEAMFRTMEGAEDNEEQAKIDLEKLDLDEKDIVIGISANGNAPYVRSALRYAKERKGKTVLIMCNPLTTKDPAIDDYIILLTGPEIVSGSTRLKAGTATKLILNEISTISMVMLGKVYGNLMVDLTVSNKKLRQRALNMIIKFTDLPKEDAASLLEAAHNNVKTAIVMHHKKVDYNTAKELLTQSDGSLRKALQQIC